MRVSGFEQRLGALSGASGFSGAPALETGECLGVWALLPVFEKLFLGAKPTRIRFGGI